MVGICRAGELTGGQGSLAVRRRFACFHKAVCWIADDWKDNLYLMKIHLCVHCVSCFVRDISR